MMSVTVCSHPSDQRAIGESVGCALSGKKSGLDTSVGPVPFANDAKPNRLPDRTQQCNQVPQRVCVVVGAPRECRGGQSWTFFSQLSFIVLQRSCSRFVMVST